MEKYSDCMLIYKISENKPYGEINKKNYDKMKISECNAQKKNKRMPLEGLCFREKGMCK